MIDVRSIHSADDRVQFDLRHSSTQHSAGSLSHAHENQGIVMQTVPFFFACERLPHPVRRNRSRGWAPSSPDRKARHAHPGAQRRL